MQTNLSAAILNSSKGQEADEILRQCVHCGFCLATCPTYQTLGDERDSPRGRIYLIKQLLESDTASEETQTHLDRCLTCRSCETTCPSGVNYHRLLDIGREAIEELVERPWASRMQRLIIRRILPYPKRFGALLRLGQTLRPLLPSGLKKKIPAPVQALKIRPASIEAQNKIILHSGCVQNSLAPNINLATEQLLLNAGVRVVKTNDGCCGAISFHLNAQEEALQFARRNIDTWLEAIRNGADGIISNATGCGLHIREYTEHFKDDKKYRALAHSVSDQTYDIAAYILHKGWKLKRKPSAPQRVAFHPPCTMQHGLKIADQLEQLLLDAGFDLLPIQDKHLCCGSAGTYAIFQPEISQTLRSKKLFHLQTGDPEAIISANIGCIQHLAEAAQIPVRHWIELVDIEQNV